MNSLRAEGDHIRYLTSQLRRKLKRPLGTLVCGSLEQITGLLREYIEREKPRKIVAVGDQVSKDLTDHSFMPDILIVDNRIMREKVAPIPISADRILRVRNPPGTITDEAWEAIERAAQSSERTKIVVEGEEDLLALVAIIAVPEDSVIIYGQPRKGIVLVRATSEMKRLTSEMVALMDRG